MEPPWSGGWTVGPLQAQFHTYLVPLHCNSNKRGYKPCRSSGGKLLTAKARVRAQGSLCKICGEWGGIGTALFSEPLGFVLSVSFHRCSHIHSSIIWGMDSEPVGGRISIEAVSSHQSNNNKALAKSVLEWSRRRRKSDKVLSMVVFWVITPCRLSGRDSTNDSEAYESTRRYDQENQHRHLHHREKHKSRTVTVLLNMFSLQHTTLFATNVKYLWKPR
jgi:hypothetical protein